MKCPKCSYLGFETSDRCRNCGYEFSLLAGAPAPDPDLPIRPNQLEGVPPDIPLPLFSPAEPDDAPLISLPAAPRAPLAVRRPAESPRLRAVPRVPRAHEPEAPALDFHRADAASEGSETGTPAARPPAPPPSAPVEFPSLAGRRVAAALVDHGILLGIDAAVVYFTLKMAGLTAAELHLLPLAPLVTFVGLLKLSYFTAFTAVGGQTIGKMAVGIRVIAESGPIDGGRAVRRTLAGLLSALPLGLGYLPAFVGADRRTLHDRLTQTRVVGLPSA